MVCSDRPSFSFQLLKAFKVPRVNMTKFKIPKLSCQSGATETHICPSTIKRVYFHDKTMTGMFFLLFRIREMDFWSLVSPNNIVCFCVTIWTSKIVWTAQQCLSLWEHSSKLSQLSSFSSQQCHVGLLVPVVYNRTKNKSLTSFLYKQDNYN